MGPQKALEYENESFLGSIEVKNILAHFGIIFFIVKEIYLKKAF